MKRIAFLLFLIITGCKIDDDKTIDRDKLTFKIGTDTQLFFKNVRQSYYDLEENKAAKFNVFRFSDRSKNPEERVLNLAIVVNYLQDEAYLLIEPSEAIGNENIELRAQHPNNGDVKGAILNEMNREAMLNFCTDVYELLVQGYQFEIKVGEEWRPVLDNHEAKEAFRITVSDYYRLTRVF
ncbi:hypothetical protein [Fulvivirga lutimaris]|uniref:hypothetical protein n=1 Tax=Fulvivirga lutimaris TaxID=1819566 RepID=UPI0012BD2262|nr:hypothetical protein [Fulvivirga lutimaris]MTI41138.1 hypothetical protein [Fulvivirga lutimaris]